MDGRFTNLAIGTAGVAMLMGAWGVGFIMGGGGTAEQASLTRETNGSAERGAIVDPGGMVPVHSVFAFGMDSMMQRGDIVETLRRVTRESSSLRRSELLAAVASRLSLDEVKAAIDRIRQLPTADQEEVTRVLFSRWAELHPGEAAQRMLRDGDQWPGVEAVLSTWIARDSDAALRWAQSLPEGVNRDRIMSKLIGAFSRKDPEKAFELIQENPSLFESNLYEIQNVIGRWAMDNPQGAAAATAQISNQRIRERALIQTAIGWATQDPLAALQWAESLADKQSRGPALQGVFSRWAAIDADAALEKANALATPEERSLAIGAVVMGVASNDLTLGAELVDQIPEGEARDMAAAHIAKRISASDPLTAVALAEKITNDSSRHGALHSALFSLAAENPEAVLSKIESLSDRSRYYQIARTAVGRWISKDPAEVLLGKAEAFANSRQAAVQAGFEWAHENAAKAFETLESLPRGSATSGVLEGVLNGLSMSDPRRAAEISAGKFQGQVPPESFRVIGSRWALAEPTIARDWVFRLPDGASREAAVLGVAAGWVQKDTAEATQWVEGLPNATLREQGVAGVAIGMVYQNPESALTWAARIGDSSKRQAITKELLQAWRSQDANAANEWVGRNQTAQQ